MQVFQCLDETLGELLLVGDRLRVEELGGRRGRDHPVGLDDEPFQLRGGQFEEPRSGEFKILSASRRCGLRVASSVRLKLISFFIMFYSENPNGKSRFVYAQHT